MLAVAEVLGIEFLTLIPRFFLTLAKSEGGDFPF